MDIPMLKRVVRYVSRYIKARREDHDRRARFKTASPLRIVVGASGIYDSGWIGTDVDFLNLLKPRHWERYFQRNSIDAILAEHVWEHLTFDEGFAAARLCFGYLKPGGYLRVAVPDGFHPDDEYINYVKPGGFGAGADDHKILYNHETFADVFERAGFRVELLEYFDSARQFHFVDWSPEAGRIVRSRRFDDRNQGGVLNYTSIILDAYRDA